MSRAPPAQFSNHQKYFIFRNILLFRNSFKVHTNNAGLGRMEACQITIIISGYFPSKQKEHYLLIVKIPKTDSEAISQERNSSSCELAIMHHSRQMIQTSCCPRQLAVC